MTTALAINLAGPEEWPDGQARILDTDLATLAGMGQPRDIRKRIKHYEESGDLGQVQQRATGARSSAGIIDGPEPRRPSRPPKAAAA